MSERRKLSSPERGTESRGSNLLGVGQYNERLVLQIVRRAGSLSKAGIARTTGLSPQTATVIINRLLRQGLVKKQPRQREKGKVGQPAVPIALDPGGACSLGVKIGRRSLDVLAVDFTGHVLHSVSHAYEYPDPDLVFLLIGRYINSITGKLSDKQRQRLTGIGVAAPYALGGWQQVIGAPEKVLSHWDNLDIRQRVAQSQTLPVWFANDATAACVAEHEFGGGSRFNNYLYVFVGTFIGGGVVLNGSLFAGPFNNAGAIGSMPVPDICVAGRENATMVQLIQCSSAYLLADSLRAAGFDPDLLIKQHKGGGSLPKEAGQILDQWIKKSAKAIAYAITSAISVIDFEGVVIDGSLPPVVVKQLKAAVENALRSVDSEGLLVPEIVVGRFGNSARAIGGAVLPFYATTAPDREVLFKHDMDSGT